MSRARKEKAMTKKEITLYHIDRQTRSIDYFACYDGVVHGSDVTEQEMDTFLDIAKRLGYDTGKA